jgi:hypothetical protein
MEKQMWSLQKQVDLFDEMKMQAEKDGSVVLVGGKFKYSCQLTGLVNDALAGEYFDTDLRHFHGASFLAYYEYTRGLGYWNGKETVKAHPSIKLIDDVLTAVWGTNSLAEIAEMSPLESSAIQDNQLRAGITDDERDLTPEYIALMQTFVSDGDFMSRCSNVRAEQWLRENQGDFAYEHFDYLEEYLDKHVSLNDRFRIAWQPNPSAISVFSFVIGRIGMRLNFVLPDYDFILLDKAHYAEYERLALARDNYLANPKKFFYTR